MRCYSPINLSDGDDELIVPCGKCVFCLVNKRNDWSYRLMIEYKVSKSAAFITLTYSDKFLPDQGVSKRHFQLFMKRLRKRSGARLRYYAVGEYGTKTGRPHYHAIIFNFQGDERFLQSIWSTRKREPFGIVHIGKVNEASIRYTTKYVIQRSSVSSQYVAEPFALMSRAYGLGANYLSQEMVDWHRSNSFGFMQWYDQKVRLPRYYKDKIWYRVWNKKKDPPLLIEQYDRKRVNELFKFQGLEAERNNFAELSRQGYNPHAIMAEMRQAVIDRVSEKVAFTQKF